MPSSIFFKLGASLLLAVLLVLAVNFLGDALVGSSEPTVTAKAPVAEPPALPAKAEAVAVVKAEAEAVAVVNTERGRKLFRKCKACHTPNKGGGNRVGPNLWDILGRPKASAPGYTYSKALSGLGGRWTAADLDAFLASPKGFAKGTKMSFRGFKKPEDRTAIIGFLGGLSEAPEPLPQDGR